jgi:hypothetical protein
LKFPADDKNCHRTAKKQSPGGHNQSPMLIESKLSDHKKQQTHIKERRNTRLHANLQTYLSRPTSKVHQGFEILPQRPQLVGTFRLGLLDPAQFLKNVFERR